MTSTYLYHQHLQSDRLRTRFLTPDDATAWLEFFRDSRAVELFPDFGLATAEEKAHYWINRQVQRYHDKRYGLQALVHKQTSELIGQCGLLQQEVDGQQELEVGYHILPRYWGHGYAPEAARLFIHYALDNHLADSVISIIDIRNLKSQRVAEKNGLLREKQTRWSDLDVYIYRTGTQLLPQ
jgi:[ribosomal protein S5]-alanine N-acetyltransferase